MEVLRSRGSAREPMLLHCLGQPRAPVWMGGGRLEQMTPLDCLEYADRRIKAFRKTKSQPLNKTGNDTQFQTHSFCPGPLFSAEPNAFPIEGGVQVALWAQGGVSAAIIGPPHVP